MYAVYITRFVLLDCILIVNDWLGSLKIDVYFQVACD